jgi:hypothetical protein
MARFANPGPDRQHRGAFDMGVRHFAPRRLQPMARFVAPAPVSIVALWSPNGRCLGRQKSAIEIGNSMLVRSREGVLQEFDEQTSRLNGATTRK